MMAGFGVSCCRKRSAGEGDRGGGRVSGERLKRRRRVSSDDGGGQRAAGGGAAVGGEARRHGQTGLCARLDGAHAGHVSRVRKHVCVTAPVFVRFFSSCSVLH